MELWEDNCAIVVLNYNSANLVSKCVHQIRLLHKYIKIVVVDNGSLDDSVKILDIEKKASNFILVKNESNIGYAAGNNVGIHFIEKTFNAISYVIIMNPDIIISSKETLFKLYTAIEQNDKIAIITAQTIFNGVFRYPNDFGWNKMTKKYMIFGGTLLGKLFPTSLRYNVLKINKCNIAEIDVAQGCFFMARLSILQAINYFDEGTFLYGEEVILAKKVQMTGFKEGVVLDAFIHHNHHEKDLALIKKKNKIFDIKCFYHSRKYYIEKYSGESKYFIIFSKLILNIDYGVKRIFLLFK